MPVINRNDLSFQQGETFQLLLTVQNAVVTNYSAVLQIRQSYTNNTIIEQMSTSNGEITIPDTAHFSFNLPASRTAAVSTNGAIGYPPKVTYVYDMTMTRNTGISTKIMYGQVFFYSQVTR